MIPPTRLIRASGLRSAKSLCYKGIALTTRQEFLTMPFKYVTFSHLP